MTWLNGFFLLPQANLREASLGVSCPFFPFARGSAALPRCLTVLWVAKF